jgi:hypothetical protein
MATYYVYDSISLQSEEFFSFSISDSFVSFLFDQIEYASVFVLVDCLAGYRYSYEELLHIFEDITKPAGNFLPDYYTLRYLEKEAILDRGSIAMLAVALSNLLRLANENDIDDIHFVSLRLRRIYSQALNKYFYVITEY